MALGMLQYGDAENHSRDKSLFLPLDTNEIGVKYEQREQRIAKTWYLNNVYGYTTVKYLWFLRCVMMS